MSEQSPTRSEQTVQMGQQAVKILVKEPVKEAVKESLSEEGLTGELEDEQRVHPSQGEGTQSQDEPDETGAEASSSRLLTVIVPAAALLGVALAIRQLSDGELSPEQVAEKIRGEDDTQMEEDTSKSASSESGRSQFAEDDPGEVNL